MAFRATFILSFTFIIYAFILNLSGSITSAEVDLVPMHDVSICGGMKAHYTCTVNTSYLQWFINEVPINVVFNNETTVGKNFSVDGSVFVFTNASQVSGKIIYISTASLNILQTTKVSCADATANSEAHTVNLIVNHIVNDISGRVNENNIITTWSAPTDAGVCCERYRVVTSNGDIVTTNTTSYTVHNITTQEQREYAFISVRCLDQLGTEGPKNVFRPNITRQPVVILAPEPVGDFCDNNNVTYEIKFVIPESGALVAGIQYCDIGGHSCSLISKTASFSINGLVPFNVSIIFTYYLGHESTGHEVTLNASQLHTFQEACNCRAVQPAPLIAAIFFGCTTSILLVAVIVLCIIMIIFILKVKKSKTSENNISTMELKKAR